MIEVYKKCFRQFSESKMRKLVNNEFIEKLKREGWYELKNDVNELGRAVGLVKIIIAVFFIVERKYKEQNKSFPNMKKYICHFIKAHTCGYSTSILVQPIADVYSFDILKKIYKSSQCYIRIQPYGYMWEIAQGTSMLLNWRIGKYRLKQRFGKEPPVPIESLQRLVNGHDLEHETEPRPWAISDIKTT